MGRKIGTLLSFLTIILEIFSALFLTPFIIRKFGQSEYGVYTLVISITSYLALLDLGVGNAVVRFIAKYRTNHQEDEQKKFLGIVTLYYCVIAAIAFLVGIAIILLYPKFFAKGLSAQEIELSQKLLLITTVNIAITLATSGFFYTVIAYENYYVSKGVTIGATLLRIIVSLVVLKIGARSMEICFINMLTTLLIRTIIVAFVFIGLKIRPTLKNVRFAQIKEIVAYSSIILLQMIATQINNMTDQVLIGALTTSSAVILAVYGVGSQVNHYFQTFGSALNSVLMPGVVRMVEQNEATEGVQAEMEKIGRLNFMFIGLIWCAFLVFGQQFIELWAGTVNRKAYYVALLLTFPYILILTQNIGSQILWAKNKHKLQAFLKLGIVLLNVVLTIILIRWNPLYGATIGTFISLMLGDVLVMQIVFKKDIGIKLGKYYWNLCKGIVPALAVAVGAGYAIRLLHLSGWLGFVINCVVMVVVYGLTMLIFGFNSQEKTALQRIKKKFKRHSEEIQ